MQIDGLNAGVKLTTTTNILDIDIPKQLEKNVTTGMKEMDLLMAGDGVTRSTVTMVTGVPGNGKSTIMLQTADAVTKSGNIAVYNGNEESVFQMRKTAKRLRLKHGFIVQAETDVYKLVYILNKITKENPDKVVFFVQDSLPSLVVPNYEIDEKTGMPKVMKKGLDRDGFPHWKKQRGRALAGNNATIRAIEVLASWTKQTFGVSFLINHVLKDGTFAGAQTLKHVIDVHLHLTIELGKRSENYGERSLSVEKNRFGIAGVFFPFEISERGLRFLTAPGTPQGQ